MPFFLCMIRPTLEYCAGVWGSCGEVNSGALETLQKRVGRIVIKTSNSDTAMKALKWPSLRSRRDEHFLKLVRKCIRGRCPQYFNNYFVFNKDICTRSTRQSNPLHLPVIRTEVAKRSFRSPIAKEMWQSTHPRKFGIHVTVHRASDRPSAPQAYQCKITQSKGMATQMQLKVLFGRKSHGCPVF